MRLQQFWAIHLLFLLFCIPPAAVGQGRYLEEQSGFDYVIPRGWDVRWVPGQSTALLEQIGATGRIRRNITFTEQAATATLDQLRHQYKQEFAEKLPGFKLLQEKQFKTSGGLDVLMLVHENALPGVPIRQTNYILETRKGVQFFIACTVLQADGNAFDDIFDDLVNSFRYLR